jgi:hypothetical protein
MQRLKIIKDCKGSFDGINVNEFKAGETVNLDDTLVRCFKAMGTVEEVSIEQKKAINKAPKNKSK